jgi:hypothetical protein
VSDDFVKDNDFMAGEPFHDSACTCCLQLQTASLIHPKLAQRLKPRSVEMTDSDLFGRFPGGGMQVPEKDPLGHTDRQGAQTCS